MLRNYAFYVLKCSPNYLAHYMTFNWVLEHFLTPAVHNKTKQAEGYQLCLHELPFYIYVQPCFFYSNSLLQETK